LSRERVLSRRLLLSTYCRSSSITTFLTVVLRLWDDPGTPGFICVEPDELRSKGRIGVADWFDRADRHWRSTQAPGCVPASGSASIISDNLALRSVGADGWSLYTSAVQPPLDSSSVVDSAATPYPIRRSGPDLLGVVLRRLRGALCGGCAQRDVSALRSRRS